MGSDYVNAMFESLQSNKNRINCSELFGLVIQVSLSTFATLLIFLITLICVIWPLITEKCPLNIFACL